MSRFFCLVDQLMSSWKTPPMNKPYTGDIESSHYLCRKAEYALICNIKLSYLYITAVIISSVPISSVLLTDVAITNNFIQL